MQKIKYLHFSDILRARIIQKYYTTKLPSINSLCKEFNYSKITIKKGLFILEKENLIYTKQRSGIYICTTSDAILKANFKQNMYGYSKNELLNSKTIVSHFSIIKCPKEVSLFLNINEYDFVYKIIRCRINDNIVTRYETIFIPINIIKGLTRKICGSSIYDYIEKKLRYKIIKTHDSFYTQKCNDLDLIFLDINNTDFVPILEQLAYLETNIIFQYSITRYNYNYFIHRTISLF